MRHLKHKAANFAIALLVVQTAPGAVADIVHADDVIIQGSACIGVNCVDNQSFGNDTLFFRQDILRIHFQDTSIDGSGNDWRIIINDPGEGGANYLAIQDVTASSTPFRIESGAPDDAFYVRNNGNIGVGTSTPAAEIHVLSGINPALRLDQDGSSGFGEQIWEVSGNEANFFIRDVTNSDLMPFRIEPGTPQDTLFLQSDGNIAVGTAPPELAEGLDPPRAEASLHIRRTSTSSPSIILETTNPDPAVKWEIKTNPNTGRLTFKDLNGSTTPFKFAPNAAENLFRVGIVAPDTVDINGDLVVTGNCTEQDGACADYVFEPDYELRSLDGLAQFIAANKHLPNVPNAQEIEENGVNMARFSGRLLEKIEELTLYTLQQQETIDELVRLSRVEQDTK